MVIYRSINREKSVTKQNDDINRYKRFTDLIDIG